MNTNVKASVMQCGVLSGLLYPPEASGGYFGLASAMPPPRVERFLALTL